MKRKVTLLGILFLALCACNKKSDTPQASRVRLSAGDYLAQDYLDRLRRTQSPLGAGGRGTGIGLVMVSHENSDTILSPIFNFHEGGTSFSIDSSGGITAVPQSGPARNVSFTLLDDRTFTLGFDEYPARKYAFVGDAEKYVAQQVLVGQYRDANGREFVFRKDGTAIFEGVKFKYKVGLDQILDDFDYFYLEDSREPQVFAFRREGGKLNIYPTVDEGGIDEIATKLPRYSLIPVSIVKEQ